MDAVRRVKYFLGIPQGTLYAEHLEHVQNVRLSRREKDGELNEQVQNDVHTAHLQETITRWVHSLGESQQDHVGRQARKLPRKKGWGISVGHKGDRQNHNEKHVRHCQQIAPPSPQWPCRPPSRHGIALRPAANLPYSRHLTIRP